MVLSVQSFFYLVLLGGVLFVLGRHFEDYTIGVLGGFLWFMLGLFVLINPITDVQGFFNTTLGSIFFGIGAYIWIRGGLEFLKGQENFFNT